MREIIYHRALLKYGADILYSPGIQLEKEFLQHGEVSVFAHSVAAACTCLLFARRAGRLNLHLTFPAKAMPPAGCIQRNAAAGQAAIKAFPTDSLQLPLPLRRNNAYGDLHSRKTSYP